MRTALLLAALVSLPAHADEVNRYDPAAVVTLGPRASVSASLLREPYVVTDGTAQLSIEARIDERMNLRIEAGGSPFRSRVHAAGALRVYPMGKARAAWWAEVSAHVQRTGFRDRPGEWVPLTARGWISLPTMFGGGWRVFLGELVVLDLGAHVGPTLDVRTLDISGVGLGLAATGHLTLGSSF